MGLDLRPHSEKGFDAPRLDLAAQADHFIEDGIESPHNDEHPVKSRAWKVLLRVCYLVYYRWKDDLQDVS